MNKSIKDKILNGLRILGICIFIIFLMMLSIYSIMHVERKVVLTIDMGYEKIYQTYLTREYRVSDFLNTEGIMYDSTTDIINVDLDSFLEDENTILIEKPFTVSFIDNDVTMYSCKSNELTKEDIVKYLGLTVDSTEDLTYSYSFKEEEEMFNIIKYDSSDIRIGDSEVVVEGVKGIHDNIYLNVYNKGEVVNSVVINCEVVRETVDMEVAYGTKVDWTVPEDLEYIDVISGVKGVSYNFDGTPYGVYGLYCSYGTCAVDRSIIPLGTKMFIEGYGYCIANDVGSGINGLKIDLYMDKYEQCLKWGARTVTLYIIEWGDDTTNWTRYKRDESPKYYDEYGILRKVTPAWYE